MSAKKAFGDFQTPGSLASKVVGVVSNLIGSPDLIVEPTAGHGSFLSASLEQWGDQKTYEGYELNREYVAAAQARIDSNSVNIYERNFFTEDWESLLSPPGTSSVLVIGNPPWVTNSALGQLGIKNLPVKSNSERLRGMDARTGKSNFDIAEWMIMRLIEALPATGAIAMLCKTATARKVLRHYWKKDIGFEGARIFLIDAKSEFDVSVDACLFFVTGNRIASRVAAVHPKLETSSNPVQLGYSNGNLVNDIKAYEKYNYLDVGSSIYTWRSGVKHDAAKVMEFTYDQGRLVNGFGELVEIEPDHVYPLLKSSDIGNGRTIPRKAVLITQKHTGEDPAAIAKTAPHTWAYLLRHATSLDGRGSSIYRKRGRFSIFGIGDYSFAPWKVGISSLYKNISFAAISPSNGRPVMVDDTCYIIPCQSKQEAELLAELLSSEVSLDFLKSLIFLDSKRPITAELLRRLSFIELASMLGKDQELGHLCSIQQKYANAGSQLSLVMDPKAEYQLPIDSTRVQPSAS